MPFTRLFAKWCANEFISDTKEKTFSFQNQQFLETIYFLFLLFLTVYTVIRHLFDMRWEGQFYSMLISPVNAQLKSSLHADGLKSSPHTNWSNFSLQLLLLMHASCKCDNVLCSEIHTISVHLAPNVSKMAVSFSGWMAGMVESGLLQEWTLVKGTQWREAVWWPVINCANPTTSLYH